MIAPFLLIISLGLLIYGALVTGGIYVPIRSKILIEAEGRAAWCKVEGFTCSPCITKRSSFPPYAW